MHFVDEGYFALGSVIDPSQGAWFVQYGGANAINNSRQITAAARQGFSGPIGAIRMTPIVTAIPGDIDEDGDVDLSDLAALLAAYGACSGDPAYVAAADIDASGCIELGDLSALLANYGA